MIMAMLLKLIWHKYSDPIIYKFGDIDNFCTFSETFFSFPFCKWKGQRSWIKLNEIVSVGESIIWIVIYYKNIVLMYIIIFLLFSNWIEFMDFYFTYYHYSKSLCLLSVNLGIILNWLVHGIPTSNNNYLATFTIQLVSNWFKIAYKRDVTEILLNIHSKLKYLS